MVVGVGLRGDDPIGWLSQASGGLATPTCSSTGFREEETQKPEGEGGKPKKNQKSEQRGEIPVLIEKGVGAGRDPVTHRLCCFLPSVISSQDNIHVFGGKGWWHFPRHTVTPRADGIATIPFVWGGEGEGGDGGAAVCSGRGDRRDGRGTGGVRRRSAGRGERGHTQMQMGRTLANPDGWGRGSLIHGPTDPPPNPTLPCGGDLRRRRNQPVTLKDQSVGGKPSQ